MNYTPEYYQARQAQDYRSGNQTNSAATKKATPSDGEEQWYLDGGASNRMCLSLLSGIPREVNWALSRLVNLSDEHNIRFVLATVPKLSDAVFYAPEVYLKSYVRNRNIFSHFCPPPSADIMRKHATESMLVLRNASHNDLNVAHLAQDPRTIELINDILRLPPDDEANTEIIVYAMELLQVVGHHLPLPSKGRHPYRNVPIEALEYMLSTSVDRTLIIHSLNVLTLLMTPFKMPPINTELAYPPVYAPHSDSFALARVLQLLALVQDHLLLTSSLEFFAAYLTSLSATQAFLLHPDLTKTLRLLVGVLRYEQKTEVQSVRIGPPVRTAEPEAEWLPYELSEEELARIAPMPEPERSFQWMNKIFENAPGAELTQVTFWTLYKDTFTPYSDYPMLQAADIIRNVTIEFPEASASVVNDGGPGVAPRFVIQNIRRRLKPPSPFRFRCQWHTGTPCSEAPPDSPDKLYNHVLSHLEKLSDEAPDDRMDTDLPHETDIRCRWASCPHEAASIGALRRHVLTHIPPSTPPPKNPCQPHAITLPSTDSTASGNGKADTNGVATVAASALAQPPPPPPASFVKFRGPADAVRDPPSPTTLLALYSLRMLFWASFADNIGCAAPVHDGDRFGFPSLPSIQQDLEKEEKERGGEEVREAEKCGRKAFRSLSSSLAEVHIGDPEIMWWVVDMVHRADESADIPIKQS